MSNRLVHTERMHPVALVRVYFDSEQQEYTCKLTVSNCYKADADYFTTDRADALDTAKAMLAHVAGGRVFAGYASPKEELAAWEAQ